MFVTSLVVVLSFFDVSGKRNIWNILELLELDSQHEKTMQTCTSAVWLRSCSSDGLPKKQNLLVAYIYVVDWCQNLNLTMFGYVFYLFFSRYLLATFAFYSPDLKHSFSCFSLF